MKTDKRFFDVAATVAARRVNSLLRRGELVTSHDGMVDQYERGTFVRSFYDLTKVFPVFHREAYRELRQRAGVPGDRATWEWYQVVKK